MSSQIWCHKFFPLPIGGGGGVPPKKVSQNDAKHILVLDVLRSDDFVGDGGGSVEKFNIQPDNQPTRHPNL